MSPTVSRAIVTDGLWRKSLSAIRSLGKAGFQVTVMGESLFTTGFWSRYTNARVRAPVAATNPSAFGQALFAEIEREKGAVLLPMEDATLAWIAANRERVERSATVLISSDDSLAIAADKSRTMAIAEELGLHCPKTWRPNSARELADLTKTLETGTFVVKPRTGSGSSGIVYGEVRGHAEWEAHWERFGSMIVQERIPPEGKGQGVSLLMDRSGRCVASFAHERLQQYPNSGGPSTDRQSIHQPDLLADSVKLLERLSWRGVAMVEWKIDPRDETPKLMEINPRFWGSVELAVRAGVDFPALYARAALGENLPPPPEYQAGVRCRWMIPGEILRYFTQPREARESLAKFCSGLPGLAEEWDRHDLRGALATLVCTGALALHPRYWKYVGRG